MEGKISKQTLVSLDKKEKRLLKPFRLDSKTLKLEQEDVKSDGKVTDQEGNTQLEVGQGQNVNAFEVITLVNFVLLHLQDSQFNL